MDLPGNKAVEAKETVLHGKLTSELALGSG
jgi:hypothetical protein